MNIDINNEHHRLIWQVLKTISENIPINLEGKKNNQEFSFSVDVNIYTDGATDQYQILDILKKEKVITETKIKNDTLLIKDSIDPIKDQSFVIHHLKTTNNFENFYEKFNQIFYNTNSNQIKNILTFFLNDGTIFYVSPSGEEYKGKIKTNSNSYILLYILSKSPHKKFEFDQIAKKFKKINTGSNNERTVRDAVGYLKKKLKYHGNDLFISDYGFGLNCDVNLR